MGTEAESGLRDTEVAITGRLECMSREEAVQAIARAGGRYVGIPSATTDILVVGDEGSGVEGRPTHTLHRAHTLQSAGTGLVIIGETEFVARLGQPGDVDELGHLYTTAQLGRILDVPVARLRAWIRHELLRPIKVVKRLCYFDFGQVACARRLKDLANAGVTPGRIRKSLDKMAARWRSGTPPGLAHLDFLEHEGLIVRLDDGRLTAPTGQGYLDFTGSAGAESAPPTPMPTRRHTAEEWFDLGIAAEEAGNLDGAIDAYQNALGEGDAQPEVCFNLGNTFYATGRNLEAAACFLQATELDPEYVEAWNNLGNALSEVGKHDQAIPAYKRALSIEPSYADAHYNLGETLAILDDRAGAEQHWLEYLKQDPNSQWANRVRERLAEF